MGISVHVIDATGNTVVSKYCQFETMPRIGESIIIHNDSCSTVYVVKDIQHELRKLPSETYTHDYVMANIIVEKKVTSNV